MGDLEKKEEKEGERDNYIAACDFTEYR